MAFLNNDAMEVIEILLQDIVLSIDKQETNRVEVWIEDRETVRGPISLHIRRDANLAELRKQTKLSLGIPKQLQKWIVGRTLCSDDNISVESLAGPERDTPFYLFLVEADTNKDATKESPVQYTAEQEVTIATNENVNLYIKNIIKRVEVWIEDRETVRGPIGLHIRRDANLADLRKQTELSLGIPKQLQKWIVGRTLCSDDNISVESLAGPERHTPFYLFLVEADTNKNATKESPVQHTTKVEVTIVTNENVYIYTKNIMKRIEIWIEDREAVRGPISLHIRRDANLAELRKQTELSLGIPKQLQKWIVGRTLCSDDNISVESLARQELHTPFYLFLVEADTNKDATKALPVQHTAEEEEVAVATNENVYNELMLLEHCALVPNTEKFECGVCIVEYSAGEGVVLKECVHTFCRECLSALVKHCEEPVVACPAAGCAGYLQEREIRELVSPEEYERWLARGLAAAESVSQHSFHCRTRDCTGWALCEPGVLLFPCPVCKHTNCIPCEAVHEGVTCNEHRVNTAIDQMDDKGTKEHLNYLIERGEAITCPECNTVIIKQSGCDWLKCSACKTDICWVTRGRRWGPGGPGDISAGCRCKVDGKRCHPACNNCH